MEEKDSFDKGGRDPHLAQVMPNHCFTTSVITMGLKKDKFVTTSSVEISIERSEEKEANTITWTIPVEARLSKSNQVPLASLEDDEMGLASISYQYQPRRRVAMFHTFCFYFVLSFSFCNFVSHFAINLLCGFNLLSVLVSTIFSMKMY